MRARPRVTAIIQARMGSSRFPGKVLATLKGKPVLWHIIERLKQCRLVDIIALATTRKREDEPLVNFAAAHNIPLVRGSENNVLQRYIDALDQIGGDIIVRITGDCPLIDPRTIDRLLAVMIREDTDTAAIDPATPTIHEGIDLIRAQALRQLATTAGDDPIAREHVTAYFKENPGLVSRSLIPANSKHAFPGTRLSVDTPSDLAFLEALYEKNGAAPGKISISAVVSQLEETPELLMINRHVRQKAASETSYKALFCCNAGGRFGFGHIKRSLVLAERFRDSLAWGVAFAVAGDDSGQVDDQGFQRLEIQGSLDAGWISRAVKEHGIHLVIFDLRDETDTGTISAARNAGALTAVIDDASPRRLWADYAFFPPTQEVAKLAWKGSSTHVYSGWNWVCLPSLQRLPPYWPKWPPRVLVTMGGTDPHGLTERMACILAATGIELVPEFVLGPGFREVDEIRREIGKLYPRAKFHPAPDGLAPLIQESDLIITAYGSTALEAAAMGRPVAFLTHNVTDREASQALLKLGAAHHLGQHDQTDSAEIASRLALILNSESRRLAMANAGPPMIDGMAPERIAELLSSAVADKLCAAEVA